MPTSRVIGILTRRAQRGRTGRQQFLASLPLKSRPYLASTVRLAITGMGGAAALAFVAAAPAAVLCFDTAGKWQENASPAQRAIRCQDVPLPVHAEVQWAFMPAQPLSSSPRLAATGAGGNARFQAVQVLADVPGPPASVALPFGQPLLPRLIASPFGVEERAILAHSAANRVTIACRPGARPAGVTLRGPGVRLPRGASGVLRVAASGDAGFLLGLGSAGQDPDGLWPADVAQERDSVDIPLPQAEGELEPARDSIVVVCPASAATLTLTDVQLLPAGASQRATRAGWAWAESRWRDGGGALLDAALQHGIRSIYISVSLAGDRLAEPAALERFVQAASASGVAVWAVEGDPGMVLAAGREHALSRLNAIKQYQSAVAAAARLAGIQYDIEPYLLSAYTENPSHIARQWRDTLLALGDAAGSMPMDVVLPFWVLDSPGGKEVASSVRMPGRSITVMAYRTEVAAIQAAAEPLLAWGASNKVPVRVALEAGPLQDELTQYYAVDHSGGKSILWAIPVAGTEVIVRLSQPMQIEHGRGYQPLRESTTPASRVSFLGNWPRMRAAVGVLENIFPAWPSYAGMSLHGLLD
ncbi:hypothetical protein [Bordetella petrii]|uniref:hypothetical protein n=1 Tax=Bordetella petrii TaxID=94624 RepID=UPI001A9651E9|nr:hypothetical protein [Bordetella petrii]MBO1114248.1 hypothetical protein [Bordetella petrii]